MECLRRRRFLCGVLGTRNLPMKTWRGWAEIVLLVAGLIALDIWLWANAAGAMWQSWQGWAFDRRMRGEPATVGRLLHELGRSRQVFCVTHLPQVACFGDHHFAVRKSSLPDGRPISRAEVLSGEQRVQEIARMLGGTKVTALTQQHAREMLSGR